MSLLQRRSVFQFGRRSCHSGRMRILQGRSALLDTAGNSQETDRGFSFELKTRRMIPLGHARLGGGAEGLVRPVDSEALSQRSVFLALPMSRSFYVLRGRRR